MATIEAAKLSYLHKKVLERYLEAPTADDEEILKLMDLNQTRIAATYQSMSQQEHPIYIRERWISEAAARLTDDGYWSWVTKQVNNNVGYRFDGNMIVEVVPPFQGWGDHASEAAMPSPFFTNTEQDPFGFQAAPPPPPMPTMAPQQPTMPRRAPAPAPAPAPTGYVDIDAFGAPVHATTNHSL